MRACVPKRDVYFDEEQYIRNNTARYGGGEARAWFRAAVADGIIPEKCKLCGSHHFPVNDAPAGEKEG